MASVFLGVYCRAGSWIKGFGLYALLTCEVHHLHLRFQVLMNQARKM